MEEDLKILEEWLKQLNELFQKTRINNTKERKALENLLKEYKELGERNKIYALNGDNINLELHIKNNYILKSLIKEKLEKLKEEYKIALEENSTKAFILRCQIHILEEILKGENNE